MNDRLLAITLVVLVIIVGGLLYAFFVVQDETPGTNQTNSNRTFVESGMKTFTSAEDFKTYLANAPAASVSFSGITPSAAQRDDFIVEDIGSSVGLGTSEASRTVERVSETNVQVQGIDEPDIVKTDGTSLFISREQPTYYGFETTPIDDLRAAPEIAPVPNQSSTDVLKAFPPEELAALEDIAEAGNLLLTGDMLIIFQYQKVVGYDVSDPAAPVKKWTLDYDDQQQFVTARLLDGEVYLVTQAYVNRVVPCPLQPLSLDSKAFVVPCDRIYYPVTPIDVDATYTAVVLNPTTGEITDSVTFVGAQSSTTVYMSPDALYVFYAKARGYDDVVIDFTLGDGADLYPQSLRDQIRQVRDYDISDEAKFTEFTVLFERYLNGLGEEARLNFENTYQDRFQTYLQEHVRDLDSSGIVKIGISDFAIAATGEVPGYLLNQFSIDEHEGFLRIATTSGSGFGLEESVNDVYVLDGDLETVGSVLGLGLGERIYSARFIGDRGYVVTFRQTDPFYVFDLSNPRQPKQTGELKIPGFSSYLDPLTNTLVLGIGEEDSKTKLSLFDVSDPANPVEAAKFQLDTYWSGIQESHHAFLHDAKHSAFFLPAGADGYVLSYTPTSLTLEKKVTGTQARRAVYINDFLYVIGETEITVLDEATWEQVASLTL